MTTQIVHLELVEQSAAESRRVKAGRRQRSTECLQVPVEESLEPDRLTSAAEWVRAEPDVRESREWLDEARIEGVKFVAVEPKISESGVERIKERRVKD